MRSWTFRRLARVPGGPYQGCNMAANIGKFVALTAMAKEAGTTAIADGAYATWERLTKDDPAARPATL